MKRRLALWMHGRALKMEPLIAIAVQQAADENACRRLRAALAEAQAQEALDTAQARADQAVAEAQRRLDAHQANVQRIAQSN